MGDQRDGGIGWTDETWNYLRGCSHKSPGCENCYAERTAARFTGPGQSYEGLARFTKRGKPQWTGKVRTVPERLADPLRWKRPRRVFVNSMSDVFHDEVSNATIATMFGVMAAARRHTFHVLTKRPERMVEWFRWAAAHEVGGHYEGPLGALAYAISCTSDPLPDRVFGGEGDDGVAIGRAVGDEWPLPNVWLGVTAEDQQRADERIPLLLQTPATVRFVSVEPQLGPVDLSAFFPPQGPCVPGRPGQARTDWVICGAESGPGARPFDEAWARALRDQCAAGGVAFFYKQALDATGHKVSTPELDGRRWTDFPEVRA